MKQIICIFLIFLSVNIFVSCEKSDGTLSDIVTPSVDNVSSRIETFLNTTCKHDKIVYFDNFNNMSVEFTQFVFHLALYKGSVHKYTAVTGDGYSKEMIEDNIKAVFALDTLPELDYNYIMADYDEERGIYIPWIYGAPGYSFSYVLHSTENMSGNIYKAVISYIDHNADVRTFDMEGNVIPTHNMSDYSLEEREKAGDELTREILENPEKYERVEIFFEIGKDYIHILSARKYTE